MPVLTWFLVLRTAQSFVELLLQVPSFDYAYHSAYCLLWLHHNKGSNLSYCWKLRHRFRIPLVTYPFSKQVTSFISGSVYLLCAMFCRTAIPTKFGIPTISCTIGTLHFYACSYIVRNNGFVWFVYLTAFGTSEVFHYFLFLGPFGFLSARLMRLCACLRESAKESEVNTETSRIVFLTSSCADSTITLIENFAIVVAPVSH